MGLLHVVFHVLGGLGLVGRVLVNEARFQLGLQKTIHRKGEARRGFALGVQANKVGRNVFHLLFYRLLLVLPLRRAQLAHRGRRTLGPAVLGNLVQRVNADRQQVVISIHQPNGLLNLPVDFHLRQPRKARNAVVLVRHVVAGLQRF